MLTDLFDNLYRCLTFFISEHFINCILSINYFWYRFSTSITIIIFLKCTICPLIWQNVLSINISSTWAFKNLMKMHGRKFQKYNLQLHTCITSIQMFYSRKTLKSSQKSENSKNSCSTSNAKLFALEITLYNIFPRLSSKL